MNDNEIIKALEACKSGHCYCGEGCPLANDDGYDDDISKCTSKLSENALDLINRQRAEIEELREMLISDGKTTYAAELEKQAWHARNSEFIRQLESEIERLEIELKAMRGAANSYKAEVERLEHIRAEMSREIEDLKDSNEHLAVFLEEARAEIERLGSLVDELVDGNEAWVKNNSELRVALKDAKAEATREFAERLKKETLFDSGWGVIQPDVIDNLVKEMTEGTE